MKKITAASSYILIATFFVALYPSSSTSAFAATPKLGAVCAKLNSTSKSGNLTLICNKLGKKLIWSKPKAPIEKPVSAPTQGDEFPEGVPAPGRSCPNIGGNAEIYGAKLSCRADGAQGKWTLDAGQVIDKNRTQTPTANATPTSKATTPSNSLIDVTRSANKTALLAFSDVKNILKNAPMPKSTYAMHASVNVSRELVAQAEKTLPTAVKFWQNVYAPLKPVDVIYAAWSDKEWTINEVKNAGDSPNGWGGMSAWFDSKPQSAWLIELGSGMHEGPAVNGVTPKIDIVVSGSDAANRPGGTTTAPHEYTHNVQVELAPRNFSSAPCWFSEGMAQYYAIALAYSDDSTYLENRKKVLQDREFGTYPFDSQRTIAEWAASLEAASHGFCGGVGGYWTGPLAVEYLISVKGTAGIIALIKELEQTGSFDAAFKSTYKMDIPAFFTLAGGHIRDQVSELLGLPSDTTTSSASKLSLQAAKLEAGALAEITKSIAASKNVKISPLISLTVEDGALTADQRKWIENSLIFINSVSPPTDGGEWNLVFPKTMEWFLKNWDMNAETQHYKDMFANNTADQLVSSVHSHGTSTGGWAASFFVNPNKNWFNPDWQMRFIAQLLKPAGFANGLKAPDWFTRSFAYPIGAAYSQITSTGNYGSLHKDWVQSLSKLPQPIDVSKYEGSDSGDGTENYKAPGSLANEILLNLGGISKGISFLKDIQANGGNWETTLLASYGITKADLYAQVASWSK
jgi:hypothetical protein